MRDLAVGRPPAKHAGNKAQRKSDQDSYHRAPEAVIDGKYVAFTASLAPPQTDDEAKKAPDECAHERNGDPGTDHSARRLCAERGENVVALRCQAHESRSRERLPESRKHHEVSVKLHLRPLAPSVRVSSAWQSPRSPRAAAQARQGDRGELHELLRRS
jgi:hypothetical protein